MQGFPTLGKFTIKSMRLNNNGMLVVQRGSNQALFSWQSPGYVQAASPFPSPVRLEPLLSPVPQHEALFSLPSTEAPRLPSSASHSPLGSLSYLLLLPAELWGPIFMMTGSLHAQLQSRSLFVSFPTLLWAYTPVTDSLLQVALPPVNSFLPRGM